MVERNRQNLGDNIFEIPFTHQNIADAAYRKKMMGTISNSVLKGEGTFSGFVAEEAAKDFLNAELVNQYGNDRFKFDLLWNNYKVEVKAMSLAVAPRETLTLDVVLAVVFASSSNPLCLIKRNFIFVSVFREAAVLVVIL